MADTKTTAFATGTPDAASDWLSFVDVSDTTMAASGTNKKVLPDNLRASMANGATGFAQRTIKSKFAETVSMADFGVVADGSTNNATALMAMRTALAGPGKPHWNILATPGQINTNDCKWLVNIRSFDLWCQNTTFLNTLNAANSTLSQPIFNGDIFRSNSATYDATELFATTYLFNDADIGDLTITTTTAGHAGNFVAGDRVFIYYFDQQFNNYPPNARFFEWNEVVSAVAGTGVITLRRPLRYDYRNAVYDTATDPPVGKPRIIGLDRADLCYCEYGAIHGGYWKTNAANPTWSNMVLCGRNIVYDGVYSEGGLFVAESEFTKVSRSTFMFILELDKLARTCIVTESNIIGVSNASGVDYLELTACSSTGVINASPKNLVVRNSTFHLTGPTASAGLIKSVDVFGIENIEVTGNTIYSDTALSWIVNNPQQSITIDDVATRQMKFDDDTVAHQYFVGQIRVGTVMCKSDGTKAGVVTAIGHDGVDDFTVDGTWAAPVAAETWSYSLISNVRCENNRCVYPAAVGSLKYRHLPPSTLCNGNGSAKIAINSWEFPNGAVNHAFAIYGYVRSMKATILRPYVPGTAGVNLTLRNAAFSNWLAISVDAKGEAQSRVDGTYESAAGSTVTQLTAGAFYTEVYVSVWTGGGTPPAGGNEVQSVWTIELELMPPA